MLTGFLINSPIDSGKSTIKYNPLKQIHKRIDCITPKM